MSDRARVEAFNERLEAIRTGSTHTVLGEDDDQRLAMARELADLDLASESLVREGLARALRERGPRQAGASESPREQRRRWRRPLGISGLAAVLLVAALAMFSPSTLSAITRPIIEVLHRVVIGPNSEIIQTADQTPDEVEAMLDGFYQRREAGEDWFLWTAYGGGGGVVPEGAEPYSRYYTALGPLARDVGFDLFVPTAWPERVPPEMRFQRGWINPDGSVRIIYCLSVFEFSIAYFPVGDGRTVAFSDSEATSDSTGVMNVQGREPEVEELVWNGIPVVWKRQVMKNSLFHYQRERGEDDPPYGTLYWERDGIGYSLGGQNLTLTWAEEIWRSLEPVSP